MTTKHIEYQAHWFADCHWCVLSPSITTLDGREYRLHCADDLTEAEARHIVSQLNHSILTVKGTGE